MPSLSRHCTLNVVGSLPLQSILLYDLRTGVTHCTTRSSSNVECATLLLNFCANRYASRSSAFSDCFFAVAGLHQGLFIKTVAVSAGRVEGLRSCDRDTELTAACQLLTSFFCCSGPLQDAMCQGSRSSEHDTGLPDQLTRHQHHALYRTKHVRRSTFPTAELWVRIFQDSCCLYY